MLSQGGGVEADGEDDDDDGGDDGGWYFGLKGRRSRAPRATPWVLMVFSSSSSPQTGQKLLQGVFYIPSSYLGRCPGLEALWPVRPFVLWNLRSLRPYISYELKNNLHPTPDPLNLLIVNRIHGCRVV